MSENGDYNQRHYEALGNVLNDHVYELLIDAGLQKIHVPDNLPTEDSTFVFANKANFSETKKLLILIHGSGVVRAGQWARRYFLTLQHYIIIFIYMGVYNTFSLIINQSLNHGTQIPYIKKALELGYDILVTNTNDNSRNNKNIPENSSPTAHGTYVWNKFIATAGPEHVAIVAHSYGGVVTVHLAKKFRNLFQEKVFAVGLTDSVHGSCPGDVGNLLHSVSLSSIIFKKLTQKSFFFRLDVIG